MKSTLNQCLRALQTCMERYSKDTNLKLEGILISHEAVIKLEEMVNRNLPEREFVRELEALKKELGIPAQNNESAHCRYGYYQGTDKF